MGSRNIDTWSWCCGLLVLQPLMLMVLIPFLTSPSHRLQLQDDEEESLGELWILRSLTETAVLRKEDEVGEEKKSYSKWSDREDVE